MDRQTATCLQMNVTTRSEPVSRPADLHVGEYRVIDLTGLTIDEAAIEWVMEVHAEIHGTDLTEDVRKQFDDWMDADPIHSMRFLEYVELWGKLWDAQSSIPQVDREAALQADKEALQAEVKLLQASGNSSASDIPQSGAE